MDSQNSISNFFEKKIYFLGDNDFFFFSTDNDFFSRDKSKSI